MVGMPQFRELDRSECERILREHRVGRLAFTLHDRVDIEPISYAYDDGWLYCRSAPGTKIDVLARHPWVAFEVDEVSGPFDWRSVVVKGTAYFVEPDGTPEQREAYRRAVNALRKIAPSAFTEADPTPQRALIFRIHVNEVRGRSASTQKTPS